MTETGVEYVCFNCGEELTVSDNIGGGLISINVNGQARAAHRECPKHRYYPEMPPMLPGETPAQYTDRLTGADGTDRRPYDHHRNRQCSIGYHDECSDGKHGDYTGQCECPHHTDPNYLTGEEQEREDIREEIERLVKDAFYDARNAGGTMDQAARTASEQVLAFLIENEYV